MEAGWESWDWETVHSEIDSLGMGDLVGSPEVEVRERFGEPDDVASPGSETRRWPRRLSRRRGPELLPASTAHVPNDLHCARPGGATQLVAQVETVSTRFSRDGERCLCPWV